MPLIVANAGELFTPSWSVTTNVMFCEPVFNATGSMTGHAARGSLFSGVAVQFDELAGDAVNVEICGNPSAKLPTHVYFCRASAQRVSTAGFGGLLIVGAELADAPL